jgi:hypothetical protein
MKAIVTFSEVSMCFSRFNWIIISRILLIFTFGQSYNLVYYLSFTFLFIFDYSWDCFSIICSLLAAFFGFGGLRFKIIPLSVIDFKLFHSFFIFDFLGFLFLGCSLIESGAW